jgi:hypothetical protein
MGFQFLEARQLAMPRFRFIDGEVEINRNNKVTV